MHETMFDQFASRSRGLAHRATTIGRYQKIGFKTNL